MLQSTSWQTENTHGHAGIVPLPLFSSCPGSCPAALRSWSCLPPPRSSQHLAERGEGRAGAERGGSTVFIPLPGSFASLPNELFDVSADAASGSSGEVTQGSVLPSPDTAGSQPRAGLPLASPGAPFGVPSHPSHPRSPAQPECYGERAGSVCWEHKPRRES